LLLLLLLVFSSELHCIIVCRALMGSLNVRADPFLDPLPSQPDVVPNVYRHVIGHDLPYCFVHRVGKMDHYGFL
jgi:hypothetical protein